MFALTGMESYFLVYGVSECDRGDLRPHIGAGEWNEMWG